MVVYWFYNQEATELVENWAIHTLGKGLLTFWMGVSVLFYMNTDGGGSNAKGTDKNLAKLDRDTENVARKLNISCEYIFVKLCTGVVLR